MGFGGEPRRIENLTYVKSHRTVIPHASTSPAAKTVVLSWISSDQGPLPNGRSAI